MVTQQRPVVMPWETPRGRRPTRVERSRARQGDNSVPFIADTGCEVHSSCFTCPLPECRFETHGEEYAQSNSPRVYGPTLVQVQKAVNLQAQGKTAAAIAAEIGCARRTVFRLLAIARERA